MRLAKKLVVATFATIITTGLYAADAGTTTDSSAPGAGGDTNALLRQIVLNTFHTLEAVNNVPNYLEALTKQAISWLALEDEEGSYIMQTQEDFANLGNLFVQEKSTQNNLQTQTAAALFGFNVKDLTTPQKSPKVLESLPYINDVSYSSLIGVPPVTKAPFNSGNYLRNAIGANIPHAIPNNSWAGNQSYKIAYSGYYNTIMAANSFGAYVLSGLIAENQNGNKLSPLHDKLITEASQSSWLAQIATEELGKVLRDILLFQSQNYVLLTKSIELQKQQLTAQILTNSLLVGTNIASENELFERATGIKK